MTLAISIGPDTYPPSCNTPTYSKNYDSSDSEYIRDRRVTDSQIQLLAFAIWKCLERVLCLSSLLCTLKRERYKECAPRTLTRSNGRSVIMRCCLDMKFFAERGAQDEEKEAAQVWHYIIVVIKYFGGPMSPKR